MNQIAAPLLVGLGLLGLLALACGLWLTASVRGELLYSFGRFAYGLLASVPVLGALAWLTYTFPNKAMSLILIYAIPYMPALLIGLVGVLNREWDRAPGLETKYIYDEWISPGKGAGYARVHPASEPTTSIELREVLSFVGASHHPGDVFIAVRHEGAFGLAWVESPARWTTPSR